MLYRHVLSLSNVKWFTVLGLFVIVALILSACTPAPPVEVPTEPGIDVSPPTDAVDGDIWTNPLDGAEYAYVSAGEFLMGSDPEVDSSAQQDWAVDELAQHKVPVDGFWIMRTEVTNAQYRSCWSDGVCLPPSNEFWDRKEYVSEPVTDVDWRQAGMYAEWVGGRLPTEAEWEKACRGTNGGIYPWGNAEPDATRLNYLPMGGTNRVVAVGSYPPGAYGLYDMAGNAWEWTSSKIDREKYLYPYDPDDGREDPEGDADRTMRGGSADSGDDSVRCARRIRVRPDTRESYGENGFRVVLSPGPVVRVRRQ